MYTGINHQSASGVRVILSVDQYCFELCGIERTLTDSLDVWDVWDVACMPLTAHSMIVIVG